MLACPRCRATYPDQLSECPEDGTTLLPSDMIAALDPPLEAGTMVGEYRIERKLGSGAFGDVYAGEQPLIGKRVAIKLLHRKLSSDAEVVSRFVAEARAVNRIRHRHIIDIFSFGLHADQRHYFVMELLDGLTLRELLDRDRRLSIEEAVPIFRGIASGLDAAHEAGITHRDLKPDNVFLAVERGGGYFPKLLDFGIAKLLGEDVAHRTATGMAMGTPRYMSPEQCRGRKIDHRADIYSLGVLVHEALTGRPLFDAESAMDVLFLHTSEAPPSMSSVSRDLPPELDGPVLAMLAKRPADRPRSAGEAIAALVKSAREHGTAMTLPASSAGARGPATAPERDLRPPAPPASGDASRLPLDAATVQVRRRGSAPKTPSEIESARTLAADSAAGPEVSVPVSFDTERDPPAPGSSRGSTEIAPASRVTGTLLGEPVDVGAISEGSGATLRSPVGGAELPVSAPASAPASRAAPARGAGFWALLAIAAVAVVGGAIVVSRPRVPPAATSATPEAHLVPSGAPSPPRGVTRVTPDPAPFPDPTASSVASATAPAVTPASPATSATATGKPIARPKYHGDLEPPR